MDNNNHTLSGIHYSIFLNSNTKLATVTLENRLAKSVLLSQLGIQNVQTGILDQEFMYWLWIKDTFKKDFKEAIQAVQPIQKIQKIQRGQLGPRVSVKPNRPIQD